MPGSYNRLMTYSPDGSDALSPEEIQKGEHRPVF